MKLKFFLTLIVILGFLSCSENNPIGDYPVSLTLDLTFSDKALRDIPSYQTYTLKNHTPNNNYRSFGFGGVLVVHSHDGNYHAYDLSCPYEANQTALVETDEDVIYAICPKCGTKYDITAESAFPVEGIGKSPLKQYTVSDMGNNKLFISN